MNSMTGFGRATQIVDGLQCIIEIKSVNSRFLDLTYEVLNKLIL